MAVLCIQPLHAHVILETLCNCGCGLLTTKSNFREIRAEYQFALENISNSAAGFVQTTSFDQLVNARGALFQFVYRTLSHSYFAF